MAIFIFETNSNPQTMSEIACLQSSGSVVIPSQPIEIDFCYCKFECEYTELKLVNPGGEDYENDKSMFLDEVVDSAGTILYEIYKDDVLMAQISDDTYGIFYGIGSVPNDSDTDQSLKSGFICDWVNVYNVFGSGNYKIKTTVTNFTREIVKESPTYNVKLYNLKIADYTIVLKATQNGYIQGGMDYTGLNWEYEYRIEGKLIEQTPEFVKTTFQTSDRRENQIQAQTIRQYKLYLDFISSNISSLLIEDNTLANKILVRDYNVWNHGLTYVEKYLVVEDFDTLETFVRSQKANLVIDMKESKQDKLKRNYK